MPDPDPDPDPDPTDPPAPSRTATCLVFAGLFLSMVVGMVAAVAVGIAFDPPFWVIATIFFGIPGLTFAAVVGYGVRHAIKNGSRADIDPTQAAAARVALPVVGAFFAVAALSIGGVIVAGVLDAPWWVKPIVFFAPPVLLTALSWRHLKGLAERMKRAAPSPERAAAIAAKPTPRAVPVADPADAGAFPTVPPDPSEPGTRLARRLPTADVSAGCACLGVLLVSLFWNGIVSVFAWQAVKGFQNGNPEWFLVVFLIPFVLVGLVLAFAAVFAAGVWVVTLLVGDVTVEVDDHPFVPGGRYRGRVAQRGPFRLTKVGIELACGEAATYQAGTSESTAKQVVAKYPAELPGPFPAAPLDFILDVPADAMHSFAAAKNRITWTVTVWGRVLGVVPYGRSFLVVVHPGGGDG